MTHPTLFRVHTHAILLQWNIVASKKALREIYRVKQLVQNTYTNELLDVVPSYQELAIYFKRSLSSFRCEEIISEVLTSFETDTLANSRKHITIPVCYEGKHSIDLSAVATRHRISEQEVVRLHTQPEYTVAFIGFLPGFPYLEGLSKKLVTPRKTTPRTKVAAGSVGIGNMQTGIYTQDSPGGWNIIGRTPLCFFSSEKTPPSLLQAGDTVAFRAIPLDEYDVLEIEITTGIYKPEISER